MRGVTPVRISAHYCGLPVMVEALSDGAGELQCPRCRKRYEYQEVYVWHVFSTHPKLIKGGNAA